MLKRTFFLLGLGLFLQVNAEKVKSATGNMLKEGSCESAPKGWYRWIGSGKIELTKDEKGLKSGAGLKVTATGEKVSGSVSMPFYRRGELILSGYISCTGSKPVKVAIQSFNKQGKQVNWKNLAIVKNDGKKRYFKQKVKIPEKSQKTNLTLFISSPGVIRVDELKAISATKKLNNKENIHAKSIIHSFTILFGDLCRRIRKESITHTK